MALKKRLSAWLRSWRQDDANISLTASDVLPNVHGLKSDPRVALFRDHVAEDDVNEMLPSFDPQNLLVAVDGSSRNRPERDWLVAGDFDKAKPIVAKKISSKSLSSRTSYFFDITSGLHELRHFHDYFGTTCGFARFKRVVQDAIEFNSLWDALKKERSIKTPLVLWGKSSNAPKPLKDYLAKRRSHVEWINLYDGSVDPPRFKGTTDVDEGALAYEVGGLSAFLPAVPINLGGSPSHRMVPLGMLALMEGTALVSQGIASNILVEASDNYCQHMLQAASVGRESEDDWLFYIAVNTFLAKRLGPIYAKFQLALSDVAMMAESPQDMQYGLPGRRLSLATAAARGLGELHLDGDGDLEDYMKKITERVGWRGVREIARDVFSSGCEELKRLEQIPEADTLWPNVLRAALRTHLGFMTMREHAPDLLCEPSSYFGLLKDFPPPSALRQNANVIFRGITEEDMAAFRSWVMFEHFQTQLLFSNSLCCPIPSPHTCPGDPFTSHNWSSSDTCVFSLFLDNLEVTNVTMEPLIAHD